MTLPKMELLQRKGLWSRQSDKEDAARMRWERWIAVAGVLAVSLVGLLNAPISSAWRHRVLIALIVLIVVSALVPVVPPVSRRVIRAVGSSARDRRIRATWQRFQRQVEDFQWVFGTNDARSLMTLLGAIRPVVGENSDHARLRRELLPRLAPAMTSIGSVSTFLLVLCRQSYPGERTAQMLIEAVESILVVPSTGGIVEMFKAEAREGGLNRELVEEWLNRYRHLLDDYAKFATEANRDIGGTPVYRQYF